MNQNEIDTYFPIFSNVDIFSPLNISTSTLYKMWVLKYNKFTYITMSLIETTETIDLITDVYKDQFTKTISAFMTEYKPLENYNSTETEIISGTTSSSGENSTITTGDETQNSTTTGESTESVSPYDSENFNNNNKENMSNSGNVTTNTSTDSTSSSTVSEENSQTRSLTRSGNIGVTTSQQMLMSEYELRKINIINDYLNIVASYILSQYIM